MHRGERKRTGGQGKAGGVQREINRKSEEKHRRKAIAGNQPDELGIIQGQNGEQGNTIEPRNVKHEGDVAH